MSSSQQNVDYILDQIASAGAVSVRKMFGEYALYCDGKVFAFVCDDQLFLKPTQAGRNYIKTVDEKPAYPGSKMYFRIDGEQWDDREWLTELIRVTVAELPIPKPKKKK